VRRFVAVAALLVLAGPGCENTTSDVETGISPPAAGLIFTGALTTALLAAEAAWVVDVDVHGDLQCPVAEMDSDTLRAQYSGCEPESGLTSELFDGALNLTVPVGTGLFDGTLSALGPDGAVATGSITGSASSAGDFVAADVTLQEVAWTELRGESPIVEGFFDVDGDSDEITVMVDGASWDRGQGRVYTFWFEDVVVPRGSLDTCAIPVAGTFRAQRGNAQATVHFSEEAAAEGTVSVELLGEDEPSSLRPCG